MVRCFSLCILSVVSLLASDSVFAQQTVLLDFSMDGCLPCRQMQPIVSRLQQEGFPVREVNGSRQPAIAQRFGVDRYPTFVLVSNGQIVRRAVGRQSYETLRGWLASAEPPKPPLIQPAAPQPTAVPVTFAQPNSSPAGGYQVGSDLGPAPSVTIPGQPAASAAAPDPRLMLNASVRLKVKDSGGSSFGTGTIIDARQGEALVLTCGHLFRDDTSKTVAAPPQIMVELYDTSTGSLRVVEQVVGHLISYDLASDVALVSIRPREHVQVAKVAASPAAIRVSDAVWSVGCDRGADPSIRSGSVTTTDRYHKPLSLTVTGAPVVGRSGGGLFNERGEVVGVCFGADNEGNEGFYAKLASVHAELDKMGLTEIYRGPATTLANASAPAPRPQPAAQPAAQPVAQLPTQPPTQPLASMPAAPANPASDMVPVQPREPVVVRGQSSSLADSWANLSAAERAAFEELSRRAVESEVVCVIRPKTPGGKSEVIKLDRVSPEFLRALQAMQASNSRQ